MSDQDKFGVEVGPHSARLESQGKATERLTHSMLDLISPLTESAGLIGDHVRVFRQRTLMDALEKTHEIAKERGQKLRPVPPKFLLEWVEGASLEDEGNEEIKTLWAKLLASASANPDAQHLAYIDFIKKLTPAAAQLIGFLARDTSPIASTSFYSLQSGDRFISYVPDALRKMTEKNPELSWDEMLKRLEGLALQSNRQLLYAGGAGIMTTPTKFYRENEHAVSILEREGAVRVHVQNLPLNPEHPLQLCWMEITKFTYDFVWACEGYPVGPRRSDANNGDQKE